MPFIGHSPILFNTKDIFSTDSEDAKSSWAATTGVSFGLFPAWYAPLKITETAQGNQAASNVSAATNLSVSGLVPWSVSESAEQLRDRLGLAQSFHWQARTPGGSNSS